MKSFLYLMVPFLLLGGKVFAQECPCKKDVMDFKRAYAETVSYKEQMKNSGTEARFNKVYDSLVTEITCSETQWDCFLKLTQLKDVIRDEHSRVFSGRDPLKTVEIHAFPAFQGRPA